MEKPIDIKINNFLQFKVKRYKSVEKPRSGDIFIEHNDPIHAKPRSGDIYFTFYL